MAAAASSVFFPEELIIQVLSFLPVKSLIRLKCVSKFWNFLIYEPTFIKLHLNRSSQNVNVTCIPTDIDYRSFKRMSFTVIRMLDNPPTIITTRRLNHYHQLKDIEHCNVIGSSNGLICLASHSYYGSSFHIWNPATRTISKNIATHPHFLHFPRNFAFGYDNSKYTYKLVRFVPETTNVRVLSLRGDNVWRDIENSPVNHFNRKIEVVHFSCSVNWLTIDNNNNDNYNYYYYDNFINIEQFVIISLDLSTETHTKFLPPEGFNEVPWVLPSLSVLNDYLCFCHAYKKTHIIIWQMKEFGVEDSWTQLLKISYHDLQANGRRFNSKLDFRFVAIMPFEEE